MQTNPSILTGIEQRLRRVRSLRKRTEIESNAYIFLAAVVAGATFLIIAEALFYFSSNARSIAIILSGLAVVVIGGWMLVRPMLQWAGILPAETDEATARSIGFYFPAIRDRLTNALQLAKSARSPWYSSELTEESLKEFSSEIRDLDFTRSIDTSFLSSHRKRVLYSLSALVLVFILFPSSFTGASIRLIHFTRSYSPPAQFAIEISPGNTEVVKGANVELQVRIDPLFPAFRRLPSSVDLRSRPENENNEEILSLKADSTGIFRTVLHGVRTTTEYYAVSGSVESARYRLTVVDRPLIRSLRVWLEYPGYTHLPPKVQDDFVGDVTALTGTRVTITLSVSKPVVRAAVVYADSTKGENDSPGGKETFSLPPFRVTGDNSYHISVVDEEGLSNVQPVQYRIKAIPDESPVVAIVRPGKNVDVTGSQPLPLEIHARDDFGITRLRLGYRLIQSKYAQPESSYTFFSLPLSQFDNGEMDVSSLWDLGGMNLVPEDVVEYFAEVFDNDAVRGPKSGRSSVFLLRLPSLDEVFADVDTEHERALDNLKESLEQAKNLKNDVESINRDLKKNKDPDWQTQNKMGEMAKQYQEIQKKLNNAQARLDQMTDQMQQQNVLSDKTMEKYLELQHLFQQLDATEIQNLLKQLQQQLPSMSKEQLQQAMKNVTFSEEQFRQSIERTMNLLKRIQIEQKVDELRKRAQELTKAEKDIGEKQANTGDDDQKRRELSQQQADLAKNEQSMEREAADLQQRMEEFFTEMPADKMKQAADSLRSQRLDSKMQQTARQMQSGNMSSAQQMQTKIGQQLEQFGSRMDEIQQQMNQGQSQYVSTELRKAANNLLELSKDEESLKQQSQSAPPNSPQFRENAQIQQEAKRDLENVINGLSEVAQRSFAVTPQIARDVGAALARMDDAWRALEGRNGAAASQEQGQAMAALNRAAMNVQNSLQAMMQGGGNGAGSLLQQLRAMAGQQMSINLQTQQLGGMSTQQAAEASRLAGQQAAVQKSLEQLNREAQQSGDRQQLLGDLQKIADEMKEVVGSLEQNAVNPETIKRQERILSRLLDASTSMNERDYEKKRKSETGTAISRRSPKELNSGDLEDRNGLHEELLKALEQGYSRDYQELIRKYFEELEKSVY